MSATTATARPPEGSFLTRFNPRATALLLVDVQNDYCHPDGIMAQRGYDTTAMQDLLNPLKLLVEWARRTGVLCLYLQQTALPDGKSDSSARRRYKQRAKPGLGSSYPLAASWGHAICAPVAPTPTDIVVTKHRSNAFVGTSLALLLRANAREDVLIGGVTTEGCVESTVRGAIDLDFTPIVLTDCVASAKKELHSASLLVMQARHESIDASVLLAAAEVSEVASES